MELTELSRRALKVQDLYATAASAAGQQPWTRAEFAQGLVGDVGDLMKLMMAKDGRRSATDLDARLAHELADCLWSVLVLAKVYDIDLEKAFITTMDGLENKLTAASSAKSE